MVELPFLEQARQFWALTVTHALVMFPYVTLPPFLLSPLLQTFAQGAAGRRVLERPNGSPWRALWLGICSPPGRGKIFREAEGLFAAGVSPSNVLAYLIAAHSLLAYFVFLVAALNGPQPVLGLALSALVCVVLLRFLLRGIPAHEWQEARALAPSVLPLREGTTRSGGVSGLVRNFLGDLASLWWPLVLGTALGAVIATWGLAEVFFSIPGGEGVAGQVFSAGAGLLLSYVSGVPPVGNVYPAAWLWKAEFFTYAGLMAFYLGVLVTPFALPRYAEIFGRRLAWKVAWRLGLVVVVSSLLVTAFWYGLDSALHAAGFAEPIEALIDSEVKPSPIPWFHRLFWAEPGMHGMHGM
ncbi:MAG: permease [Gemmatimonadetes bacterium]|nr:permease [Gemmatimonadota bacterium]